jgi:tetratricopeptide (TPR) repeat protein
MDTYLAGDFLDSVPILIDIALSYDDQLADAYLLRGDYYAEMGKSELALSEINKSLELNPNNWIGYNRLVFYYFDVDLVKTLENKQKAIALNRGPQLPYLLSTLGSIYETVGIAEKSEEAYQQAFDLSGDSTYYLQVSYAKYFVSGNDRQLIDYWKKQYLLDTTNYDCLWQIAQCYGFLGENEESLRYAEKFIEKGKIRSFYTELNGNQRIGYAYWQNGYIETGQQYFDQQIDNCNRSIELGRSYAQKLFAYYDLAGIYAFLGDKEKAYENLRIFNQRKIIHSWLLHYVKNDPLFDSLRDEPEFQQIVRDVEAKYQAEHERVMQWLEENELL